MRDDVYARIIYIINNTKGSKIIPHRECFKVLKDVFPNISDYTIGSIYSLEYTRKMKQNHFKISKIADELHNRYNEAVKEGQPEGILLRMSDEIDLSPALLARLVVQQRYLDRLEVKGLASSTKVPGSNSVQEPGNVARKMPPIVESVKESMTNSNLLRVTTEQANIPASTLKESELIVSEALPTFDSTTETMKNGTSPTYDVKITDISASNVMDEATPMVGNGLSSIGSARETIKNAALVETYNETINIMASNFTDDAKFIVNDGVPGNEFTSRVTKDPSITETKIEIKTLHTSNFMDDAALVVAEAPSTVDSAPEAMTIETKTETAIRPKLNLAASATVSTRRKSEGSELNKEDELPDNEDEPTPKLTITRLMKNPKLIDDPQLAIETFLCTLHDDQYGPLADCVKHSLGQEFEMRLVRMARAAGMIFSNEGHLRTTGFDKTPDVKLDVPIIVDGFIVNWIESKALFGDEETHKGYINEQYQCYCNRFGSGMVIYWFGFLEKLNFRNQDQFLLADDFPKMFSLSFLNQ